MRERSVARDILLTFTAALTIALSACASTRAQPLVALPNGYSMQPDKSARSEIVKRDGHAIVPAPIAAYAVSGTVVTGALGEPAPNSHLYTNDLPFNRKPDTRYFVLDTLTGKLDTNLDEATWKKRLQELGVPPDLHIYAPLPW
jgi:hypothetical protein